jgi:hypothetical protein
MRIYLRWSTGKVLRGNLGVSADLVGDRSASMTEQNNKNVSGRHVTFPTRRTVGNRFALDRQLVLQFVSLHRKSSTFQDLLPVMAGQCSNFGLQSPISVEKCNSCYQMFQVDASPPGGTLRIFQGRDNNKNVTHLSSLALSSSWACKPSTVLLSV